MSTAPSHTSTTHHPPDGVLLHPRERERSVQSWLLLAAQGAEQALREWDKGGVALLKCGRLFAAVAVNAEIIHAAAGTTGPQTVNAFLREQLHGGPVFADQQNRRYYALVPPDTSHRPEWQGRRYVGVQLLDGDWLMGVPRLECTDPEMHWSYWCVPMDRPGTLCDADAVARLVTYGRDRLTVEEVRGGH
jgi:hypothetical protein